MRRNVFLIASVIVSGVFLWLALRDVPLQDVFDTIRQANLLWLLAALVMIALGLWTRALRWRGLVDFRISRVQAFHLLNITMLLNQIPLRVGEVARSLLATRSGVPVMTAATSIVVERLLDTLLVVVLLAAALTQLPDAPASATQAAALFGVATVVAFIVLIFFARFPSIPHAVLAFVERLLPFIKRLGLGRLLDHVLDGLRPLTNWRGALHAVFWTLVSWGFSTVTFVCYMLALNVQENILLMAVLSMTLASFSIAIPVSVAAIGPYQGAVRVAGDAVGMLPTLSTALGFLIHGVNILGYAILGVISLIVTGVSLGDVMRQAQTPPTAAADAPTPALGSDSIGVK
jgi:uncharacterized protein (TIRG00374 family)